MTATPLNIAGALCIAAAVWICFSHNSLTIVQGAPRVVEHSPSNEVVPANGSGGAVKVGVDLVLVPVTVTDQRDHLVLGLQKDSFNVFDQGKQEAIRHLSSEDAYLIGQKRAWRRSMAISSKPTFGQSAWFATACGSSSAALPCAQLHDAMPRCSGPFRVSTLRCKPPMKNPRLA